MSKYTDEVLVTGPRSAFERWHSHLWVEVLQAAQNGTDELRVNDPNWQFGETFTLHELRGGIQNGIAGLLRQGW